MGMGRTCGGFPNIPVAEMSPNKVKMTRFSGIVDFMIETGSF